MSLADLQAALDGSLAKASPFTRSLFEHNGMDAAQVAEFVNTVRTVTIATVSASGDPHAVTAIAACLDGAIYFTASRGSAMLRNMRRRPRLAFTVAERAHDVVGRGTARLVGRSLELAPLLADLAAATKAQRFAPDGWDGYIYVIEPDAIFAG